MFKYDSETKHGMEHFNLSKIQKNKNEQIKGQMYANLFFDSPLAIIIVHKKFVPQG